jgi:hypothetical protein
VVEATPTGFGPTIEAVAAALTVSGLAVLADPPLADSALRSADEIRGQIGAVERGSVSFVEKARRLQAAGAAAVLALNVAEADNVPLSMVGDPGFGGIAVPVVCVRGSSAELCRMCRLYPRFYNTTIAIRISMPRTRRMLHRLP